MRVIVSVHTDLEVKEVLVHRGFIPTYECPTTLRQVRVEGQYIARSDAGSERTVPRAQNWNDEGVGATLCQIYPIESLGPTR